MKYNPARGIRNDFDKLLEKFIATESVRYQEFTKIWREMNMTHIMSGRTLDNELRLMLMECFRVAVQLWMPPNSLQSRIGALYIIYALYMKQVFPLRVKIRVTTENWVNIQEFISIIQKQGHYDAHYIFLRLRYLGAFYFVAKPVMLHPHTRLDIQHKEVPHLHQQHTIISSILAPHAIEQLGTIHEQYNQIKLDLQTTNKQGGLAVVNPTLVQNITKTMTSFEDWKKHGKKKSERKRRDSGSGGQTTSESDADSDVDKYLPSSARHRRRSKRGVTAETNDSAIGRRRAQIRDRAFSAVVESRYNTQHADAAVSEPEVKAKLDSSTEDETKSESDDDYTLLATKSRRKENTRRGGRGRGRRGRSRRRNTMPAEDAII